MELWVEFHCLCEVTICVDQAPIFFVANKIPASEHLGQFFDVLLSVGRHQVTATIRIGVEVAVSIGRTIKI